MMLKTLSVAALLASAAFAAPALAQDAMESDTGGLPAECAELGPALDEQTLSTIQDLSERRLALSCMVGTPRDYQAELAGRDSASQPQAVDIEETWGSDAVAQGLEQSAEANAEATGDLQTAVASDETLSQFLRDQGYAPVQVIGYVIMPNATYLYVAPEWSADAIATGAIKAPGANTEGMENHDSMGSDTTSN